eukprot:9826802-Lingulodinium_polyedra.AAC.1
MPQCLQHDRRVVAQNAPNEHHQFATKCGGRRVQSLVLEEFAAEALRELPEAILGSMPQQGLRLARCPCQEA